jgi:hypothetical protein
VLLDDLDVSFGIVLVVVIAMISFVRLVAHLAEKIENESDATIINYLYIK